MIAATKKDITRTNLLDHGSILVYSHISATARQFARIEIIEGEYTLIHEGWCDGDSRRIFDNLAAIKKYVTVNHF